jgi:hypothetical protein
MMNRSKYLTYGQLSRALIALGFSQNSSPHHTVFRNQDHDAIIVLPKLSPMARVRANHLITASETVVRKGIADQETFRNVLLPGQTYEITPNGVQIVSASSKQPLHSKKKSGSAL